MDYSDATVNISDGKFTKVLSVKGTWKLPYDLKSRKNKNLDSILNYKLVLTLNKNSNVINYCLNTDNQSLEHRLRLILNTDVKSRESFADTPFGVINRPVVDPHFNNWKEIGYKEQTDAFRPMLHFFANIHSKASSWTFLGLGSKAFQVIGNDYNKLAITMFRGVKYLGRPDMLRRPNDASGIQAMYVPTPHSELLGEYEFRGGIIVDSKYDTAKIQREHLLLTSDPIYYQNQTINRFTTPLQFFKVNQAPHFSKENKKQIKLNTDKLVISSNGLTRDDSGYYVRLYNPSYNEVNNAGTISLGSNASISLLFLNTKVIKTLETSTNTIELGTFKPGEIRTYGINFISNN